MADDRLQELERLFHAARALPADERARFLDEECGADAGLRGELEQLLAAHGNDEFLRGVPFPTLVAGVRKMMDTASIGGDEAARSPTHPGISAETGRRIGPYTVLEQIGEGGMGVVYLARQESPVQRRVALKLIKPGMDSKSVLLRFQAEQQAMAHMDHPGVAKVFDAGETENGHPYFVMEYVPGLPLTEYCDRHELGIGKRLDLFIDVCNAIQHAHQKGIIHRDLKPSNILASDEHGVSLVKVIDFGVAKAVNQRLSPETIHTQHGLLIGTLEYMSPEQVKMTAQDIDTRVDIYSLGVLLYELLTGTLPFDRRELRDASFVEMQRLIREEEPPQPSTRLSTGPGEPERSAKRRCMSRKTLIRSLQGDLDWVVMKALEKNRERRYQSAGDFVEDIRRYRRSEPVSAGPPSHAYRIGKFVRRNRTAVLAGALVLLALLGGTVGTTLGLLSARKAQRLAATEAAIANAVVGFLNDDLLSAPALENRGRDATVFEVLDSATTAVEEKFGEHPLVEAAVRRTLGVTNVSIGEYEAGERHLTRALELYRAAPEPPPLAIVQALTSFGYLRREMGRLDEAAAIFLEARQTAAEGLGEFHPLTVGSAANLGEVYRLQGDPARAVELLEPLLAAAREHLPPNDGELIVLESILAATYTDNGNPAGAERVMRSVIERATQKFGPDHPEAMTAVNNLGATLYRQGRYGEAVDLFRRNHESRLRVYGPDHVRTLSAAHNLGNTLQRLGRMDEAEPYLIETLERREQLLSEDDWKLMVSLSAVASLRSGQDRHAEALPYVRRSVELRKNAFGEEHARTVSAMRLLGEILHAAGRFDEAERILARALEIDEESGPRSARALLSLELLLRVVRDRGRQEEAIARADDALEALDGAEGSGALLRRAGFLLVRGTSRILLQRLPAAEQDLLEAYSIFEDVGNDPGRRNAARELVALYESTGRPDQADSWRTRTGVG